MYWHLYFCFLFLLFFFNSVCVWRHCIWMPVKHQLNAPNFVVCARMRMCQIPEYNSYTKRNVIIYFGCRLSANRHSRHSHSLLLVPRSTSSSRSLFAFNNPFICVNTSIFHAILFFSFIIFISFCLFFFVCSSFIYLFSLCSCAYEHDFIVMRIDSSTVHENGMARCYCYEFAHISIICILIEM